MNALILWSHHVHPPLDLWESHIIHYEILFSVCIRLVLYLLTSVRTLLIYLSQSTPLHPNITHSPNISPYYSKQDHSIIVCIHHRFISTVHGHYSWVSSNIWFAWWFQYKFYKFIHFSLCYKSLPPYVSLLSPSSSSSV